MRRRDLLPLIAALGARPLAAGAQQPAKRRLIATLSAGSAAGSAEAFTAFRQALRARGYRDDNITVESRWADGHGERLPGLAAEIVRLAPEVIVTTSSETALAAKAATATIPIVMGQSGDPVDAGIIASLGRPGGNITGLSSAASELSPKLLELLKTLLPQSRRFIVLLYPKEPTTSGRWQSLQRAAPDLQTVLVPIEVNSPADLEGAFAEAARQDADALVVLTTTFFIQERRRIAELAVRHHLPAIHDFPQFVIAGGLISYGADSTDLFRRAAVYVDKILKGAAPADLPVEQPTKFILAINLKTAKALGLTVPQSILARADQVIE